MTLSVEKTLRDIAVLLVGPDADGASSSEHALETIRSAISKAKGATSVSLVTRTGLTNQLDVGDLAGERAILLAPTASGWQANTSYALNVVGGVNFYLIGAWARPTTPTGATFQAVFRAGGTTGDAEPTWPADGTGPTAPDGDLVYPGGQAVLDSWPGAGQTVAGGSYLVAGGMAWSAGAGGAVGLTLPVFAGHVPQDTVTDGAVTWTAYYRVATWAALTRMALQADELWATTNPSVRPTIPNGYIFPAGSLGLTATNGETEPNWGAIQPGAATYAIDGDVVWQENTGNEVFNLTGMRRPSAPALLTLAFAIPPDVVSNQTVTIPYDPAGTYGADFVPATGDAVNVGAGDLVLGISHSPTARLFHTSEPDDSWTYLGV